MTWARSSGQCFQRTDRRALKLNRYDRLDHVTHSNSHGILLLKNRVAMYIEICGFKSRPGDGFPDTSWFYLDLSLTL